jgi:hypothetical protein
MGYGVYLMLLFVQAIVKVVFKSNLSAPEYLLFNIILVIQILADPKLLMHAYTWHKKNTCGSGSRPTLFFFNAIDRATLFSPGGCGLLPKWRLLSH